jgi:hypothetical protein
MIRVLTYGNKKIWLFIQQLHQHTAVGFVNPEPLPKHLCYFKFSEPTVILFGELIRDPASGIPFVFDSSDEAEKFAESFLQKKYNLKSKQNNYPQK